MIGKATQCPEERMTKVSIEITLLQIIHASIFLCELGRMKRRLDGLQNLTWKRQA